MTEIQYMSRLAGIISPQISAMSIVFAGVGGGSTSALAVGRMGIGKMILIDPDKVEFENLCRTCYRFHDIGKPKVEALADIIRDANPFIEVVPIAADVTALPETSIVEIMEGADLLIAGTDSLAAQAEVNLWSLCFGCPAVFIGIHQGARGGRIVWTIPRAGTPCYRCVSEDRYSDHADATDLRGEHASILDALFVDMIATKIALSILERGQPTSYGRFFDQMRWRTEVAVRMDTDHEYTATIRERVQQALPWEDRMIRDQVEAVLFHAMDSLWLPTEVNPNCPDCSAMRRESPSHEPI